MRRCTTPSDVCVRKKSVRFEVRMGKGGLLVWGIPVFIADVYLVISNVCFHLDR